MSKSNTQNEYVGRSTIEWVARYGTPAPRHLWRSTSAGIASADFTKKERAAKSKTEAALDAAWNACYALTERSGFVSEQEREATAKAYLDATHADAAAGDALEQAYEEALPAFLQQQEDTIADADAAERAALATALEENKRGARARYLRAISRDYNAARRLNAAPKEAPPTAGAGYIEQALRAIESRDKPQYVLVGPQAYAALQQGRPAKDLQGNVVERMSARVRVAYANGEGPRGLVAEGM